MSNQFKDSREIDDATLQERGIVRKPGVPSEKEVVNYELPQF